MRVEKRNSDGKLVINFSNTKRDDMKKQGDINIAEPKEVRLHLGAVEQMIPDVSLLKTLKTVNVKLRSCEQGFRDIDRRSRCVTRVWSTIRL